MHLVRRITASLSALVTIAILTSCTTDGSGTLTGPGDSLDRKPTILESPEVIGACQLESRNVFMEDVNLPFTVDCEDMNEAVHVITSEYSNGHGCTMETRGTLIFPSTNHEYSYVATRNNCGFVGAQMIVCGSTLSRCVTLNLPGPTVIGLGEMQAPLK